MAQSELSMSELIREVISCCKQLRQVLEEARLPREEAAVGETINLLSSALADASWSSGSKKQLREDLDVLASAVSDPRGFPDYYLDTIDYVEWRKLLHQVWNKVVALQEACGWR